MQKSIPTITLRREKEHIMRHMHPWIFSNAFEHTAHIEDGSIVDILGANGKTFYARGYYNSASQIAVRILTRAQEEIDESFFERRLRELHAIRERFIDERETNAYRVCFGESDGMPGLIIDRYDRTFVLQIHTKGMDMLRPFVVAAMKRVFEFDSIVERSDVGVRLQEGLKDKPVGVIEGRAVPEEIEIREHGVKLLVHVLKGQKTGFFLDQRDNRKALQKYVRGAHVLNCFCYTAGFSLYAALGGAKATDNVDVSGEALETAKRNFRINNMPLEGHKFHDMDVFEFLDTAASNKETFDVIILDPPAFVKNKKSLEKGLQGYSYINQKALSLLPHGGILVSSSCSAHVTDEMFQRMLAIAAAKSRCTLKALEIRHQPIDHPFNPHFPEGKYLKFYVMLKQSSTGPQT